MNYDSGVNKAHSYDAYNFRMPLFIDFPNEWMWILYFGAYRVVTVTWKLEASV